MEFQESPEEKIIQLPKEILEKCNGFSFDFGGSVIKICYLAKSDWENGCPGESEGPLRLLSFQRENLDACLEFLKNNAFIRRSHQNPKPVISSTGLGGFQFGKLIEEKLEITVQNITEMDAFAHTINTLVKTKPLEEFCRPFDKEVADDVKKETIDFINIFTKSVENGHMNAVLNDKSTALEQIQKEFDRTAGLDRYCLGSYGSAWASTLTGCYDNNKYSFVGFTSFAGRSFLGLGCLLTGAKSYDELLSLAEKGNNLNLDNTDEDITERTEHIKDSTGGDVYSDWSKSEHNNRPIFNWGKGVGKNLADFRPEDVARSLVYTFCLHLAHNAYDSLISSQAKHLFVAGSFCNHPLIRKLVTNEFEYRKLVDVGFTKGKTADYHLHFLEYGSHFGAIGSLLIGAQPKKETDSK